MKRREFLKGAATAALVPRAVSAMGRRPDRLNVLFIMVDDLRPELKCYGREHMVTPAMDRLAAQGTLFENTFCQSPVCGASRASLMLGIRPTKDRFIDYDASADKEAPAVLDLPAHFRKNGYRTLAVGKVFHFETDRAASWDVNFRPEGHREYFSKENLESVAKSDKALPFDATDAPEAGYFDCRVADRTIEELGRAKSSGKPFFLAAGFARPHLPFTCPKKYWDLYERNSFRLADNPEPPKDIPKNFIADNGEIRGQYTGVPAEGPLSDDLARTLIHGYSACVSFTDAMVGRVLAELDRLGLRENTVVALWGDNGWHFGEHGDWCKHTLFDESLRVPLIISAPGMSGNGRCNGLVESIDLNPTLCELAGLPLMPHIQCASLVPYLREPFRPGKDAVFARYWRSASIRTESHLLVEWRKRVNNDLVDRMMYDLKTDPGQNLNVAELPEYAAVREALSARLGRPTSPG